MSTGGQWRSAPVPSRRTAPAGFGGRGRVSECRCVSRPHSAPTIRRLEFKRDQRARVARLAATSAVPTTAEADAHAPLASSSWPGSSNQQQAPPPRRFAAPISPPCAAMMVSTTISANPATPGPTGAAASGQWGPWNRNAPLRSTSRGPRSATVTRTVAPRWASITAMGSPFAVTALACVSRTVSAWPSCCPSAAPPWAASSHRGWTVSRLASPEHGQAAVN